MATRFQLRWNTARSLIDLTTDRFKTYLEGVLGRVQSDLAVEDVQAELDPTTGRLRVTAVLNLQTTTVTQERIEEWLTEYLERDESALKPGVVNVMILPEASP